jgi:hypothetical protein
MMQGEPGGFASEVRGEVLVFEKLRLYDWSFSASAETVVGALLGIALVVSTLV